MNSSGATNRRGQPLSRKSDRLDDFFEIVIKEGMHSTERRLRFYLDNLFSGIDFSGKSMVDVGGGSGMYSLYGAFLGARSVVCLEPEQAGSRQGVRLRAEQVVGRLGIHTLEISPSTLQQYDSAGNRFDIVLLHDSVNHLDEPACVHLLHDEQALLRYQEIFSRLSELASPGAVLIVTDCSRYNFFHQMRLPNPICRSIEWEKHQSPHTWAQMLEEHGFTDKKVRWSSFNSLGRWGRLILGNKLASYFLTSHFVLTMRKR